VGRVQEVLLAFAVKNVLAARVAKLGAFELAGGEALVLRGGVVLALTLGAKHLDDVTHDGIL
jgi:hypothetical protein